VNEEVIYVAYATYVVSCNREGIVPMNFLSWIKRMNEQGSQYGESLVDELKKIGEHSAAVSLHNAMTRR